MRKNPSTRWFFDDWQNDHALRACSLAAQGAWMNMLCICAENDGYLLFDGQRASCVALARYVGIHHHRMRRLLLELERNGVFSRTPDGVIFNRRMVREKVQLPPRVSEQKHAQNTPFTHHSNHPDSAQVTTQGKIVDLEQIRGSPSRTRNVARDTPTPARRKLSMLPSSLRSEEDSLPEKPVCVSEERAQSARTHTTNPLDSWNPQEQHFSQANKLGQSSAWIDNQALRYRLHQANAKRKNLDHNAAFMLWIIDTNQNYQINSKNQQLSPNGKLYAGAYDAIRQLERQRNSYQSRRLASPLLDS